MLPGLPAEEVGLGPGPAEVSAPLATGRATCLRLLAGVEEGGVVFLDEPHALPRPAMELLLQVLAEGQLTLAVSDGVVARTVTLAFPRFTLLAATSEERRLPFARHDRLGCASGCCAATRPPWRRSSARAFIRQAAAAPGVVTTKETARQVAEASEGAPREALRLVERALDDAAVQAAAAGAGPRIANESVNR